MGNLFTSLNINSLFVEQAQYTSGWIVEIYEEIYMCKIPGKQHTWRITLSSSSLPHTACNISNFVDWSQLIVSFLLLTFCLIQRKIIVFILNSTRRISSTNVHMICCVQVLSVSASLDHPHFKYPSHFSPCRALLLFATLSSVQK